jgi:TolB-like protein
MSTRYRMRPILYCLLAGGLAAWSPDAGAQQDAPQVPTVYSAAVLPFQERGPEVKGLGPSVTDLLFVRMVTDPELCLVERDDLKKVLDELELSQSGLVNPAQAVEVGHLTGAKILVTGSVLQAGGHLYIIAKIIGTETSRVLGASVKGRLDDELDDLTGELAQQVAETIKSRAGELVAASVTRAGHLTTLKKKLGRTPRPTLAIQVTERHVGQRIIDPAAETELILLSREAGFTVVDAEQAGRGEVDVVVTGEGFSEFAARHGQFVSVRARLEVKAVDRRTGRTLAVGRQTSVAIDLSEQVASKSALQEAAAELAVRLLPQLAAAPAKAKRAN